VELLRVHGVEAPRYTVVIRSPSQRKLCERLEEVLGRSFSLGLRSFLLAMPEACSLMKRYKEAGTREGAHAVGRVNKSSDSSNPYDPRCAFKKEP
jgi:hypothetical protein